MHGDSPCGPRGVLPAPRSWPTLVAALWIVTCGCLDAPTRYSRHVGEAREQAFRDWKASQTPSGDKGVVLSGKLSLQDAVKLGLRHNKRLLASMETRGAARGGVIESYGEFLPSLSVGASYARLSEVGEVQVGGATIEIGDEETYSVDLTVSQPVFRGGASTARLRSAWLASLSIDERLRETVQGTIFAIASEYFGVLLAQELFLANDEAVRSAGANLEEVRQKRAQGLATDYDVLRAEVDLSNFQAEMIQQRNRISTGKIRLLKEMGVSQESRVELSEPLEYLPMEPDLEESVRLAYRNRPDLNAAELDLRRQEEAVRIVKSGYLPQIDASFSYLYARPDPVAFGDPNDWGSLWQAGASVRWFLFDGFRREGRLVREDAILRQRGLDLREAEEKALLEIQQAIVTVKDADEFVQSQKLNLTRASEALRLVSVGYREGLNAQIDVVDARSSLTQARSLYYTALHSHTIARLQLQRALGILGPWAGDPVEERRPPEKPGVIEPFMK